MKTHDLLIEAIKHLQSGKNTIVITRKIIHIQDLLLQCSHIMKDAGIEHSVHKKKNKIVIHKRFLVFKSIGTHKRMIKKFGPWRERTFWEANCDHD